MICTNTFFKIVAILGALQLLHADKIEPGESIAVMPLKSIGENDPLSGLVRCLIEQSLLGRGVHIVERTRSEELLTILSKNNLQSDGITLALYQISGSCMGGNLRFSCRTVQGSAYIGSYEIQTGKQSKIYKALLKTCDTFTPSVQSSSAPGFSDRKILIAPSGINELDAALVKSFHLAGASMISSDNAGPIDFVVFSETFPMKEGAFLFWRAVDVSNGRIIQAWHLVEAPLDNSLYDRIIAVMKNG